MKYNPAFVPGHLEYGPELVEQSGLFDDDLFAISKAKSKRTRIITCVCCDGLKQVQLDREQRLCDDCISHRAEREADLRERLITIQSTKRRLRIELVETVRRLSQSDSKRWSKLLEARKQGTHADRIAAIAQDASDPLSGLLQRLERYETCKQYLDDRVTRIVRALGALHSLKS